MFTRVQITVVLGIATSAWGIVLWLQGTLLTPEHIAPFGTVVGVLVFVALAMEKWAWGVPLFQGRLFDRPDLRGTWKVKIESMWVDPATGQGIPPITAYASVVQTLTKLQIQLMTPESGSCLLAHSIKPTSCGNRFDVAVVYANTPKIELRGMRSERHVGAAIITTHGSKYLPDSMTSEYWTDRRTVGRMTFENRVSEVYSRYEDAQKGFE